MIKVTTSEGVKHWQKVVLLILHILVLAAAGMLFFLISYDTFRNIPFLSDPNYIKWQFWICMLFILDVFVEFLLSPKHWKYIVNHIFFLIVSIPYLNIINHYGITVSPEINYLMRFVPMIRAAYVLAVVTGLFTSNRVTSMFTAYIALLISVLYFSSLIFFVEEHSVNPDVKSYWSALWWAFMNMTTAGCYINEYTVIGKVLSVILSGGGLILFPVFTVYIANAVSDKIIPSETPPDDTSEQQSQSDAQTAPASAS